MKHSAAGNRHPGVVIATILLVAGVSSLPACSSSRGSSSPDPDVDVADTSDDETGDAPDAEDDTDGSGDVDLDVDPDVEVDDSTADTASDVAEDTDTGPPPLYDLALIRDESTLDCTFTNKRTVVRNLRSFDVWNVSYISYESIDGALVPIRMRGFAAKPSASDGPIPGVVNVHGLGGMATESTATGPAALLDTFVIAATGPGGGDSEDNTSEGRPSGYDSNYRIFDTVTDPRGSWLWAHAFNAMRALTCLATRPEVDDARLGMTGYSGGGIATLISAAVDDRLVAAVPLSGTGGWVEGAAPTNSWFHGLLTPAGLDTSSAEWDALVASIDPVAVLGTAKAPIFLVNGSTDEFFPLTAHAATLRAIGDSVNWRTAIAANYDHGCYSVTGGEAAEDIEARAVLRAEGAMRAWFHHHFGTDGAYAYIPGRPNATVQNVGGWLGVGVEADPGGPDFEIDTVRIWASADNAVTFHSAEIDVNGAGVGGRVLELPYSPDLVWFVDVEYREDVIIGAERFSLSTVPSFPDGHVPSVRAIADMSCLP